MDDLISRRVAIDALDRAAECWNIAEPFNEGMRAGYKAAVTIVLSLPSAQPERKRGRWIYGEDNLGTGRDGWFCSECGHFELWDYSADMKSAELNLPNYCPNCGADMREDMATDAPTIEQPEIIRCRECKWHRFDKDNIPYCYNIDYGYGWKDDDFCSRAERREVSK